MPVIAELKAFDRLKWSADRWVQGKFPYVCGRCIRYVNKMVMDPIKWFYEERQFDRFEPISILYRGEYVAYSTYNERKFEDGFKDALKWLRCRQKDACEAVQWR